MTTIALPCRDATQFCRFCLSQINLLLVIRPNSVQQEKNQKLLTLIETHLQLQLQGPNHFPSAICEVCIARLREFDAFFRSVHDYDDALKAQSEDKRTGVNDEPVYSNMLEPTMIEIYEPPPDETGSMDMFEDEVMLNALDGQIILEDIPLIDTEEPEKRIDVYHIDGELQHIVMESGTRIEMPGRERLPDASTVRSTVVRKRNISPNNRTATLRMPPKVPTLPTKPAGTSRLSSNSLAVSKKATPTVRDTVSPKSKQLYRCNYCKSLFVELPYYQSHKCRKPLLMMDRDRFRCKLCSMVYRTKLQYDKHEFEVHGIRNENFGLQCNLCQKLFSQRQDYQLHMQVMHPQHGVSLVRISE